MTMKMVMKIVIDSDAKLADSASGPNQDGAVGDSPRLLPPPPLHRSDAWSQSIRI